MGEIDVKKLSFVSASSSSPLPHPMDHHTFPRPDFQPPKSSVDHLSVHLAQLFPRGASSCAEGAPGGNAGGEILHLLFSLFICCGVGSRLRLQFLLSSSPLLRFSFPSPFHSPSPNHHHQLSLLGVLSLFPLNDTHHLKQFCESPYSTVFVNCMAINCRW